MTGLHAIQGIENAAAAVLGVANLVRTMPPGARRDSANGAVTNLGRNLYAVEAQAQAQLSQQARIPLPAPDPSRVGGWVDEVRRVGSAQDRLGHIEAPAFIEPAVQKIVADASGLAHWISSGSAPMAAAPMAAAPMGAVAAPIPSAAAIVATPGAKRAFGALLSVAQAIGIGVVAYKTYGEEKRRKASGLDLESDDEPTTILAGAQSAIEDDLPGAVVRLKPTPDGEWVATVQKGSKMVARFTAPKPQDAAGQVVKRALEYTDAGGFHVSDADLANARDVTPAKTGGAA